MLAALVIQVMAPPVVQALPVMAQMLPVISLFKVLLSAPMLQVSVLPGVLWLQAGVLLMVLVLQVMVVTVEQMPQSSTSTCLPRSWPSCTRTSRRIGA
mmetsp:Transcript_117941/g.340946  ORF Transcript_117941/g.340946 Transcript_117941/m.340946 type:complete len:98 (+) Transcript_117941:532-825(+)